MEWRLSGMITGNFRLICYISICYKENIHRYFVKLTIYSKIKEKEA